MAYLGLAKLAVDRSERDEAETNLKAASVAFAEAGNLRGRAAVLVLRINASADWRQAAAAEAAAKASCSEHNVQECLVESLLASAEYAEATGSHAKVEELWSGAEMAALQSGHMPIHTLSRRELNELRQFAKPSPSVAQTRSFYRWAMGTGDQLLIMRSSSALEAVRNFVPD